MSIVEDTDEQGNVIYNVVMSDGGILHFKDRDEAQNYIDTYPSFVAAEE